MKKIIPPARLAGVLLFLFAVITIYIVTLYDIQVIQGDDWSAYAENNILVTRTVEATRGRILDRNETNLISNRSMNHIVLDWPVLRESPADTNDTLLSLVHLTQERGYEHTDTLPISSPPFEYTEMNSTQVFHLNSYIRQHESGIRSLIRQLDTPPEWENGEPDELSIENVTAVQLMAFMRRRYGISAEYTAEETRIIAGIRYEFDMRNIIGMEEYLLVTEVSPALITAMLERNYPGVRVVGRTGRQYDTALAAHVLGRVGRMTTEDLERFPDYPMDAYVGREGLERDFETFLHGTNGQMTQTVTATGVVIDEVIHTAPEPGHHVITTLDIGMQAVAESALRTTIRQIDETRAPGETPVGGGAIVVLDPNNGEVLALASAPTFSPETYTQRFTELEADLSRPLFNRATGGVYSPGSAFKMVTALAALYHNIITEHSTFFCDGAFRRYEGEGYIFRCMGVHGHIGLQHALAVSCNVYFYYLADSLGVTRMAEFAESFGLGELTGIGFGEAAGQRSTFEIMRDNNVRLGEQPIVFAGEIVQVGIGQGLSLFTPLQLAQYTAMLATGGVRYRPHFLREVRSYDNRYLIYRTEPEVIENLLEQDGITEQFFAAIQAGMVRVSTHGTAASALSGFPVTVGSKTGTVEVWADGDFGHGVFVGYAPAENPQFAFAVVIEHAGSGAAVIPAARAVLEYAFGQTPRQSGLLFENMLLP